MGQKHTVVIATLLAISVLGNLDAARADTIEISPGADLGGEISRLQAGDELVLQGGTYTLSSRLSVGVRGTDGQPIVIRSQDGENAHITRDASQNVINVENASHLILRGLQVTGGSHGIRISDSSFITIEGCEVFDTEAFGGSTGFGE